MKMKKFECCQCHNEYVEESPFMWGECYPYSNGEAACKKCASNYQGPDDEYYENFYERNFV